MKVLILGATGILGPHIVKVLEGRYQLRLTDDNDVSDSRHEYRKVDVSSLEEVVAAAEGMDAIINLSVLRHDRKLAFDVSTRGCYNTMVAAVKHGIRRVINTGPHFTIAGPTYEDFDSQINPDVPPHPGTNLYALTKSLGQEICRVFTENHDLYVVSLLFYSFRELDDMSSVGQDFTPFSVTWEDAAEAFRRSLEIDLEKLPSRCEVFYILADLPHQKFTNEKAKRILGWQPKDQLEQFWRKSGA